MRVCVVGAGVSGLPAIKECVAAGLEVVAYERTADIGGLWNYRPEMTVGGTVMKSTVVNTSKEMMAYSDFPPPESYPNFAHHTLIMDYLRQYSDTFDLLKYIKFNANITELSYVDGEWRVVTDQGVEEFFNYALLCTGHHSLPSYPSIRDENKFNGRLLHAHQYREPKEFIEKDVFIVGLGNSSLDIAAELAKCAKSVTISTRRGTWIFNRVSAGGMPYDIKLITRMHDKLMDYLPWTLMNDFMEYRLQQRIDHDLYGLRPNHRFFAQHPTLSDDFPNLLCSGRIRLTDDVERFSENGVFVKNGQHFQADVIIYATGYTFAFPFLNPTSIIPVKDCEPQLYKYVFPIDNPTIAVIGLIQPIGSLAPISEMQARWAAAIFSSERKLPSNVLMRADIEEKTMKLKRRYYESPKHTFQVDFVKYMDEIAEMVGCKPNLYQYLLTDPCFLFQLAIGPNAPYVYRLNGPGAWKDAKRTIMELSYRVKYPMKNRQCKTRRHKRRGKIDEYFRYASLKWLASWTCLIVIAGLWTFCSGSMGMAPVIYFIYVIAFLIIFSFMLLWFNIQYDMTTIF